jgi:hypothetical protein
MLRNRVECRVIYSHPLEDIFPHSSSNVALEENMVNVLDLITAKYTVPIHLICDNSFTIESLTSW